MAASPLARAALPALLLLAAAACGDEHPTAGPGTGPRPEVRPVGLVEVTISGIGTSRTNAAAGAPSFAVTRPQNGDASGDGSIQMEAISSGSFTQGTRGVDGARYLWATFRVRNADAAGTPYNTPRQNLTFLAVTSAGTAAGTPFTALTRFDGSAAAGAVAPMVVPTGAVALDDSAKLEARRADVLQVLTEAEAAAVPRPGGVLDVLPYGFVVSNPNSATSRTLPANPAPNQWDGLVTFAFRVPLQANAPSTTNGPTKDPFSIRLLLLAVDDGETRVTESMEEQDAAARADVAARAAALGATTVTVLAGSPSVSYPGQRQVCTVRVAGPSGAPTTTVTAPGPYTRLGVYRPGETIDACLPDFRGGTVARPATGLPYTVNVYAMDRYGNMLTAAADTVQMGSSAGSTVLPAPAGLVAGQRGFTVTYMDYGVPTLMATGRRFMGSVPVNVFGITRTWTGDVSTDWHSGGNWSDGVVPMSQDTAIIPAGRPNYPVLVQNTAIGGLYVADGTTVTINSFNLTATSSLSTGLTGGITNTSGQVLLTGTAKTVRGIVPSIRVLGTYSLDGNLTTRLRGRVELGRLRNERYRIRINGS